MDPKELRGLYEAYSEVYAPQEVDEEYIDEAEGSYGATPKAYSAASKTKMTAKRKPFIKKMLSRTNPANRTPDDSPRKGLTADDRERARAGAAHGVGTRQDHDYPSQGAGGVTKSAKKLRKQKAMGEFAKEEFDIFDVVLEFLQAEGFAETLEEAEWMMANVIDEEAIDIILGEEFELDEAEGSYGATPKAYSAASKTKMTAKRKPFLKKMQSRTNPANRTSPYDSPRKGMTSDDRERARAGAAHGVGTRQDHDYPSQGAGGVTKNPKKLRKQKAMGEFAKEQFELWVNQLVEEGYDLSQYTWEEMEEFYLDEASRRDEFTRAAIARNSGRKGGITFEPGPNWDPSANRGRGAHLSPKQKEKQRRKALRQEEFEAWLDEAMTNYEKNRKRAAQRAAARNAARDQGKTGAVPGVGYVTPRRERETWTDESGKTRHAKGL
jgi:hypothetical protein